VKAVAKEIYGPPTRVMGAVGPFEENELDSYLAV